MGLVRARNWPGVYPWPAGYRVAPRRPGLGAAVPVVSGPGGEAAINCSSGLLRLLDPFCWSIWNPLTYGDKYPAPPMPPAVGSTLPGGAPIPAVPPDAASPAQVGVGAGQIVQSITDQQIADLQAANQGFFEELNPEVNPPGSGLPTWVWWALGGAVVLVFVKSASGGPRRYGR
jgi:hypothetical protein